MAFEQQWIEHDYNPFILYSSSGRVLSLNIEAQFLLGAVDKSVLYEIAVTYASTSFGFKTTFLELEFGRYRFFGITVGYENEDEIGIRLYQKPAFKLTKPKPTGELVNIYTLIDLCISTNSINSETEHIKEYDPTIPEIRLQAELFIKLLNKIYAAMKNSDTITTSLYFRIGEHIRYEDVKYSFFSVEIKANDMDQKSVSAIEELAERNNLPIDLKENMVTINIPMIMD
ncbi:MAG: hypothetical protein B5M52_01420 [Helicobacteraceae bacterium 4484_230]|nr:MAG: hypothetical protein B5M52_01420 [Helicobacteraceae bacterium 4484_230]